MFQDYRKDLKRPYVSLVIITTGKNLANIKRVSRSIKMQDFRDYEVIVASESNSNKIVEICKSLNIDCRVIETGYWNRCRTANLAIIRSEGELVALLEDDVELESHWLSEVIKCIEAGKDVGCVYSTLINPLGSESIVARTSMRPLHFVVKAINALRAHHHIARKNLNVFSLTVICRKEALLRAGLFDMSVEEPIVAEDYDLALRIRKAGYKIVTCSEARALHYTLHAYKRALLAFEKGPEWWGKLIENDTYFFAKHYDLLGVVALTHALYNAFISPLALLLKLKIHFEVFIWVFLHGIKGSLTGLIRGILVEHGQKNL
jgi:GT2 family glycosyltransferase